MRELTDRWILPLRGDSVVDIDWGPEHVHLILDSQASIVVGYGTHLTPGNEVVHVLREAARDAIDRHGYLWFSGD